MDNDVPAVIWLIVIALGAFVLGAMMAWATARYRAARRGILRRGLRPTDNPAAGESQRERYQRMETEADAERGPADPTATEPRDVRAIVLILVAALVAGGVTLGAMFLTNTKYDGSSPVPVGERR